MSWRGKACVLALLLMAGCREEAAEAVPQFAPLAELQTACTRAGGEFLKAGGGSARACIHTLRDGGKQCQRGSDCVGECLARSNSCAPVAPLYGCHEVLMENGARAMHCRD